METETSLAQNECVESCKVYLSSANIKDNKDRIEFQRLGWMNAHFEIRLLREKHIEYFIRALSYLPPSFVSLDARYYLVFSKVSINT